VPNIDQPLRPQAIFCFAIAVAALVPMPMSGTGYAQSSNTNLEQLERELDRIRRQRRRRADEDIPVTRRAQLDFGGFLSQYFLTVDDIGGETHILRDTELILYGRANLDGAHELFARGRATYEDFNEGDSFDGDGDELVGPELDRAYYRFDLSRAMEAYQGTSLGGEFQLKAGRQLVHWGNGLALSTEIDGGRFTVGAHELEFEGFLGRSYSEQVDLDSSRPGFEDDMDRNFYGAMVRYTGLEDHTPYLYAFGQDDRNDEVLQVGPSRTAFEYDSYYIGTGLNGAVGRNWRYGVEAVYEGGENLSFDSNNATLSGQTTEDIQAWAVDGRVEYLLGDDANTRFSGEITLASGDDDRAFHTTNTFGGNEPGTYDQAFNGFGLLETGYAFSPNVSNLILGRVGVSSYPFHDVAAMRRLQLGSNVLVFNKMDSDAPIDEPTSDNTYLGTEADFYANWQVTSDVSLMSRYGVFFPGQAFEDSDPRHFFYSGVTLAF